MPLSLLPREHALSTCPLSSSEVASGNLTHVRWPSHFVYLVVQGFFHGGRLRVGIHLPKMPLPQTFVF